MGLAFWEREGLIWKLKITPIEKLVLLSLNQYADSNGGNCFPSASKIAENTGLARPTVSKNLSSLETKKYLSKKARYSNGLRSSNNYQILYENMAFPVVTQDYNAVTQDYNRCNGGLQPLSSRIIAAVTEDYRDQIQLSDQRSDPIINKENTEKSKEKNLSQGENLDPSLLVDSLSIPENQDLEELEKLKKNKEEAPAAAPNFSPPVPRQFKPVPGNGNWRDTQRAIAQSHASLFDDQSEEDEFFNWLVRKGESDNVAGITVSCLKNPVRSNPNHRKLLAEYRKNKQIATEKAQYGGVDPLYVKLIDLYRQDPRSARQAAGPDWNRFINLVRQYEAS